MKLYTEEIGITEQQLQKIHAVLSKYKEVETVVIYGSRAKGNFRPGSDIDLCFKGPKVSQQTILKIGTDLDDTLLPFKFDISSYNDLDNKDLIDHINRVGKIFFENI